MREYEVTQGNPEPQRPAIPGPGNWQFRPCWDSFWYWFDKAPVDLWTEFALGAVLFGFACGALFELIHGPPP